MTAPAILEASGITMSFGGLKAVDGISLGLMAGELRCVIGPNGAGKSTFFKILGGQLKPSSGRIRFAGRDITRAGPHRRALLGIGVKFQSLDIYPGFSVAENLMLPLLHRGRDAERETARLLAELELEGSEALVAGQLPHGEKQRLAIGMALALRPQLLLLDEPTAGMGPEETAAIAALVRRVNEQGVSVMVVEHDMAFVKQLEAPITVLHFGRVFAEGSFQEIESHKEVRQIYLGG